MNGSSPHTRGTRPRRPARQRSERFIPAYAGNAESFPISWSRPPGSSPHTRGTRLECSRSNAGRRFIPAYAGNASAISRLARSDSVHPRIRGERLAQSGDPDYKFGSSPHTRGTHVRSHRYALPLRFIPAYAGNAWVRYIWTRTRPVHPRIRGERMSRAMQDPSGSGSSPHTRGTPTSSNLVQHYSRFIPAYAGNARPAYNVPGSIAVHPRIRGERQVGTCRTRISPGSSPHTRGTLDGVQFRQIFGRFIPAYAGNAPGSLPSQWPGPVHPRIRGERSLGSLVTRRAYGSSPHTRGTLLVIIEDFDANRFIPAYAGNASEPD